MIRGLVDYVILVLIMFGFKPARAQTAITPTNTTTTTASALNGPAPAQFDTSIQELENRWMQLNTKQDECESVRKSNAYWKSPVDDANLFYKDLQKRIKEAESAISAIKTACLEGTSLPLQEAAKAISQVNTQPTYVYGTSLTSICSQSSNMFDKLKQAAAAYEAICGGVAALNIGKLNKMAKDVLAVDGECKTALGDYPTVIGLLQGPAQAQASKDYATLQSVKPGQCVFGSVGGNGANCHGDAAWVASVINGAAATAKTTSGNLVTAGMSLLTTAYQNQQLSNLCKTLTSASVDCTKTPLDPTCTTGPLDCNLTANANNQTCICILQPGLPACAAGASGGNVSLGFGAASGGDPTGTGGLGAGAGGADPAGSTAGTSRTQNPSSAGGFGASSGSDSGGGAAPGAAAKDGGAAKSQFNTNVLGGGDSGGGGAKSKTSVVNDPATGAYGKFLPKKGLAAAAGREPTSAVGEISGPNSKSNWEKVSDRYKDDRGTLLPR